MFTLPIILLAVALSFAQERNCTFGEFAQIQVPGSSLSFCLGDENAEAIGALAGQSRLGFAISGRSGNADVIAALAPTGVFPILVQPKGDMMLVLLYATVTTPSVAAADSIIRVATLKNRAEWSACERPYFEVPIRDCLKRKTRLASGDAVHEVIGGIVRPSDPKVPMVLYRKYFEVVEPE